MDLYQLERRLTELETIFGIIEQPNETCLVEQIIQAEQQLIETNHKTDKEINQQIFKIVSFLTSDYTQRQLTTQQKATLIAELEPQYNQDVGYLDKILKLSKHVDFEPIIRLEAKQNDIALLKTLSKLEYDKESSKVVCQQSEGSLLRQSYEMSISNTEELVKQNEIIVDDINQKLLFYQSVIEKQK